jgi:PAS domain-containing protein
MTPEAGEQDGQHQIEMILMKQVASYLATPIFLVDASGDLVYFNEPAELLLGRRYDETDEMAFGEWSTVFRPTDEQRSPIAPDALPLAVALAHRRPAHRTMWIKGLDGADHHISVTAFPLVGQHDRHLGAVAIFWDDAHR